MVWYPMPAYASCVTLGKLIFCEARLPHLCKGRSHTLSLHFSNGWSRARHTWYKCSVKNSFHWCNLPVIQRIWDDSKEVRRHRFKFWLCMNLDLSHGVSETLFINHGVWYLSLMVVVKLKGQFKWKSLVISSYSGRDVWNCAYFKPTCSVRRQSVYWEQAH